MAYDARQLRYHLVRFDEKECLWTALEVKTDTIPDGLFQYDLENRSKLMERLQLREGACEPETRHSTLLSGETLMDDRVFPAKLRASEHPRYGGKSRNILQYAEAHRIPLIEPDAEIDLWPGTNIQERGLLKDVSHEMLADATVGCLRGDFGSDGKQRATAWHPAHEDAEITDAFHEELSVVFKRLEDCGLLRDRGSMREFVSNVDGGLMKETESHEYSYYAESENYWFHVRCSPRRGVYDFYLTGYDKALFDPMLSQDRELPEPAFGEMG